MRSSAPAAPRLPRPIPIPLCPERHRQHPAAAARHSSGPARESYHRNPPPSPDHSSTPSTRPAPVIFGSSISSPFEPRLVSQGEFRFPAAPSLSCRNPLPHRPPPQCLSADFGNVTAGCKPREGSPEIREIRCFSPFRATGPHDLPGRSLPSAHATLSIAFFRESGCAFEQSRH